MSPAKKRLEGNMAGVGHLSNRGDLRMQRANDEATRIAHKLAKRLNPRPSTSYRKKPKEVPTLQTSAPLDWKPAPKKDKK